MAGWSGLGWGSRPRQRVPQAEAGSHFLIGGLSSSVPLRSSLGCRHTHSGLRVSAEIHLAEGSDSEIGHEHEREERNRVASVKLLWIGWRHVDTPTLVARAILNTVVNCIPAWHWVLRSPDAAT